MNEKHVKRIADELSLRPTQIRNVIGLIDEGATVPFITRYRKEVTGSLDEVAITDIRDRSAQLAELDKRRETILKSLDERGLLTDELKSSIDSAETLTELEDIYLPYRPKRRTRATIAKERGLEPLSLIIFEQGSIDPEKEALAFIDLEKDVETIDDALAGARDIMAEWVSENIDARERMRLLFHNKGLLRSKVMSGKEDEGAKYRDYFDWQEMLKDAPSHRVLAMRRAEKEGILTFRVEPPEEDAHGQLDTLFVKGGNEASRQVRLAVHDSYQRLLGPSMETEIRRASKTEADDEAIRVFADNLRNLLLNSPLGSKKVMAVDPGFRTGCKVCCLDSQGKLLHYDAIFPHPPQKKRDEAAQQVENLCEEYSIEAIAIGNGTAGRETETFLRSLELPGSPALIMVNESGASVYSASAVAREEFPDYDATVRGAVSIGRRLMDPLAELVKIDPKSIGVGQYQHDVDQSLLKQRLDDVVSSCVNNVGVEVNTASKQLLTYVSGLGPSLAKSVVTYRDENGPFVSRKELKKVPRLGAKAFEQAAGFLRIRDAKDPLDASAVHPESYHIAGQMAKDSACSVKELMTDEHIREKIDLTRYIDDTVGMPTLQDILEELAKPGRDPRESFELFSFSEDVNAIEDVMSGMKLPGIVTNVTAFGAFVDIGVHQDGLVHISQLANKFVKDPATIVKVNQKVMVTVLEVDIERRRISLSMKDNG